ncbi:MAG TPA: LacI family DNA-binding transcriptional regulator [Gaiellales bacterium]|nr:LacI family DNA-binding transcriptional regulator [Gaiellales bacterium]
MSVTIRDVAHAAGVSQATAARALGGYGYASDTTRSRVAVAAAQLGYRPNGVARALVSRATYTVGLVVGDIENPFFAAAARGLADVLEPEGYTVLLTNSDESAEREERAVETLRARRVDGLVVVPAERAAPRHLIDLVSAGVPLVQLDRAVTGVAADAVLVDNEVGAGRAVEHLIGLGHRRIGIVTDRPSVSSSADRLEGYRGALHRAGIERDRSLESVGGSTQAEGFAAACRLLTGEHRPSAVFTANNFMTVGTLLAIRELGLRVPEDVALVGFDDLDWTTLVEPAVTVISQPVTALGRVAGECLLERLGGGGGEPRTVRLRTELIVRGSCGAPA